MLISILSDLMYIRLNGPNTLEEFEAYYDLAFNIWFRKTEWRQKLQSFKLEEHLIKNIKPSQRNEHDAPCFYTLFDKVLIDENYERFFTFDFDAKLMSYNDEKINDINSDEENDVLTSLQGPPNKFV